MRQGAAPRTRPWTLPNRGSRNVRNQPKKNSSLPFFRLFGDRQRRETIGHPIDSGECPVRHKSSTKSRPQQTDPTPSTPVPSPNTRLSSEASALIDLFLTDFDLERLTKRARSTWQKARLTGTGPPFVRLGRLVRYRPSDFEAWLAARPRLRSTSETADRAA